MKRRAGFTLIELVVVLLIMGVIAGVAAPGLLATREDSDMDTATRRIEALLRIARDSAVRGGVHVSLVVDSAQGAVWLFAAGTGADPAAAADGPEAPRTTGRLARRAGAGRVPPGGTALDLPHTVRLELSHARARFVFSPAGAAWGDSLVLRSPTQARLLRVDPWSGDAIIE